MKKALLLLVILCNYFVTFSQYDVVHYIPPVAISYLNNKTELVFSTTSLSLVNVSVFKSDGTYLFDTTVVKGNPVRHIVENTTPSSELLTNNTILYGQGLYVTSTDEVAVNVRDIANDQYLGVMNGNYSLTSKGEKGLGTDFQLIGYRSTNLVYGILAIENGTIVTISNVGNQQITLNAGESYLINSIAAGNVIGTSITSNKKIAMSSSANFEAPGGCGDPIADQMIPNELAGLDYLIVKGAGSATLEQFTIVATEDSTYYSINSGANNLLVHKGDFVTLSNGNAIFDYKYVLATKPILIAQGSGVSCEAGQTILPPLSCTGSKIIQTKDFLGLTYDAYVIAHPTNIPTLNGVALTNPITINSDWLLYRFDEAFITNGDSILLESTSYMHCGILQSGSGYSMFAYFSGFKKINSVEIKIELATTDGSLIEGCDHGQIIINREDASANEIISIASIGTAVNGEDIEQLINIDTLFHNQYHDTIPIVTIFNNPTEGDEELHLQISYTDHCSGISNIIDTVIVIKDYFPMIHSEIDSINVCDESDVQVNLSSNISLGKPGYHYYWSSNLGNSNSATINVDILKPNKNQFYLEVADMCNQNIEIPFNVYNQCMVSVPNVITSNADDINDYFIIKNLEDYDQIKVLVLNRWGNKVYENEMYDNSFEGKTNSGNELPAGVYFYRVEVISNKYEYSNSNLGTNVLNGYLHILK